MFNVIRHEQLIIDRLLKNSGPESANIPNIPTVQTWRVPPALSLWVSSPLNNPINKDKLYVLLMFIIRVLCGINTYIHFI